MSDRPIVPPPYLRTLGGLALERAGRVLPPSAVQPRKLALLALVAAHGAAGIARDRVLGLLWPELSDARARHALAQLRYAIRRDLDGDPFAAGREIRLEPTHLATDRAALDAALAAGDGERVALLYRGPWLDGFFLANAPAYERWTEEERGSLHARVAACLRRAARAAAGDADPGIVADRWSALLAIEPLDVEAVVQRVDALVRAGDERGALATARAHHAARARELELPPDATVARLEAGLLAAARRAAAPAPPGAASAPGGVASGEGEALASSDGRATGPPTPTPGADTPPPRPRLRARARGAIVGAAVGAVLGAAALAAALSGGGRARGLAATSTAPSPDDSPSTVDAAPRSVAVMRFRSIGGAAEDRYLADGISEEVIQTLARIEGVQVASRGSGFALSTDTLTAREVGQRLGVETIVEGGVRRAGDRLRVTVRLVHAADGYTRWSETFERATTDAFAMQEAIALAIARALSVRLGDDAATPAPRRATDPRTYDLYLRGRYLWWNAASEGGVRESIAEFRRALARDPSFAPAWVGLADAHFELTAFHDVDPRAALAPARDALLRALALDSALADVHASLGYLHTFHDRDWARADARFRRALALDPRHGRARLWYAWMLAARGRHDEALREIRHARALEPLDPVIAVRVGTMRHLAGDAEGAVAESRRATEGSPGFALAHRQLGEALLERPGQGAAAVASLRRAVALSPTAETRARLAYALARTGATADARRLLADIERDAGRADASPVERARVLAWLAEPERALDLLERAADTGASTLVLLAVDPAFAPLRGTDRFRALLGRLGLVP